MDMCVFTALSTGFNWIEHKVAHTFALLKANEYCSQST